jgi:hypothetical protein
VERHPPNSADKFTGGRGVAADASKPAQFRRKEGVSDALRPTRVAIWDGARWPARPEEELSREDGEIRRWGTEAREGPRRPAPEGRRQRPSGSEATDPSSPRHARGLWPGSRQGQPRSRRCAAICSRRRHGEPSLWNRPERRKEPRRKFARKARPLRQWDNSPARRVRSGRQTKRRRSQQSPRASFSPVRENSASPPQLPLGASTLVSGKTPVKPPYQGATVDRSTDSGHMRQPASKGF